MLNLGITELLATALFATPLITGLVEVVKRAFKLTKRFVPLTAVVIGVAVGLLTVDLSVAGAVAGIIFGLTSVGLWEFGKTSVANISNSTKN